MPSREIVKISFAVPLSNKKVEKPKSISIVPSNVSIKIVQRESSINEQHIDLDIRKPIISAIKRRDTVIKKVI